MTFSPPPTLPATSARVLALCAEDDFSLAELVRVIQADPAMSSRVLRLANSAYFGYPRQIGTLDCAVQVLGRIMVQALVLGHSLLTLWGKRAPAEVERLWVHAYLCALGCRHLTQRLPKDPHLSQPDTLFVTGLLHDIGKILFLADSPEVYGAALAQWTDRESLLNWERGRFGSDHAEAGGAALEDWSVPFSIAAVVRYHHRQGLRAELLPDWNVLRVVDDLAAGTEVLDLESPLPRALLADLSGRMDGFAEDARAFYRVIQ